jgi:hypothetical protein
MAAGIEEPTSPADDRLGRPRRGILGRLISQHIFRKHAGPASILALALLVVLIRTTGAGFPSGIDSWGHLFKADYLASQMRLHGLWAYVSTAWMPAWYLGDPFRTLYPPLTTLVIAPLAYLAANPILAYQVFVVIVLAVFAALMYGFLADTWGPWAGGLGAVLALLAPYQMRTLFYEGNFPRVLAVLGLPLLAWITEKSLTTRGRRVPWVILGGLVWVWTLLAHAQQAYMFAVGFGIYVAVRMFLDPDVELRRLADWVGAIALGLAGAAPWLVPAYSHGEFATAPFLPIEKVAIYSAPSSTLLPAWVGGAGGVSLGTGMLALAILAAISRPEPRRTAWLVSGLICLWLAFGPPGVLFNLIPLNSQLLPKRFLNYASFAMPVAAAGIVPFRVKARALRTAIVVALVALDVVPTLSRIHNVPFPEAQAELGHSLAASPPGPSSGRAVLMAYPEPTDQETYFAAQATAIVNGWALESTPQQDGLRRYLSAPSWGKGYLQRLLGLWNVRAAVVEGDTSDVQAAKKSLAEGGFQFDRSSGPYEIWTQANTPGYVQALPEGQMLLVGDRLNPMLGTFPFAQEADAKHLSDLPSGGLNGHPVVGLYQFEGAGALPQADIDRLRSYLEGGGVIVTDLSSMEDRFGQTLDFFGVTVVRLDLQGSMTLHWEGPAAGLPQSLPLTELAPKGWSGAAYQGLDGTVGRVEYQGRSFGVLGYRDVGKGRIWFVGLNLLHYAQDSGNLALTERLRDIVLQGQSLDTSLTYASIPVTDWAPDGQGLSFSYQSATAVPSALVSYTYSPRFRASVDGEPLAMTDYQHLIRLSLPAGEHTVRIEYHPFGTVWPWLGLMVALVGVVAAVGAEVWERRTYLPPMTGPEVSEEDEQEYAPCSNCGFLLAEIGPPTAVTYPFQVVHCPICGMQMDDEGFQPGRSLSEDEKKQRLSDWLIENNYDPTTVHERWGFARDQFFESAGGAEEDLEPGSLET